MKVAYFDCISGVSGDMILGALVACGVPLSHLNGELKKISVDGFEIRKKQVNRSGISAVHIDVIIKDQSQHRNLSHIREIIMSSELSERVKDQSLQIFTRLAEVEAKVHGTTLEEVHFHEVGALDAIVDIVGACIGLEYLNVERVVSTPLRLGTGTVKCEHGTMPVPVPAVIELTRGIPVVRTSIQGELTTPTGAAIITFLASSYEMLWNFTVSSAGYGAGSRIREQLPNVLRITVGDVPGTFEEDRCLLLETNIDDMNPEIFGYLADRIFEAGAKDVYMSPVYMKKGRPGTLLSVLIDESIRDVVLEMLFSETTTLGVRIISVLRKKLKRESKTIETEFGPVRVKVSRINGRERYAPEFDDCARIAAEKGIPLLAVYEMILKKTCS